MYIVWNSWQRHSYQTDHRVTGLKTSGSGWSRVKSLDQVPSLDWTITTFKKDWHLWRKQWTFPSLKWLIVDLRQSEWLQWEAKCQTCVISIFSKARFFLGHSVAALRLFIFSEPIVAFCSCTKSSQHYVVQSLYIVRYTENHSCSAV